MSEAVRRLRKILELERTRRFANSAVIGGLDAYLRRFLQEQPLPADHRFLVILRSLPPGGYAALHRVQRRRVVEALLAALGNASSFSAPPGGKEQETGQAASVAPVWRPPSRVAAALDSPVTVFKGVRRAYAARLGRLGVRTVRDLLFHFPFRYADFSNVRAIAQLVVGEEQTVVGTVWAASETTLGRRKGSEAIVGDDTGTLRVIWWGQTYIARQLRAGLRIALSGRVTVYRGRRQMESPEWEPLSGDQIHTGRLVPVYPSTEGLPQRLLRRLTKEAVDSLAGEVADPLPSEMRRRLCLPDMPAALRHIHFPDSREAAAAARRRFALEELLLIQLGVLKRRQLWQAGGRAPRISLSPSLLAGFTRSLPFSLTAAQGRAVQEILADIACQVPMSRLLEGDVGSGKTVVATVALLATVVSGYQGAIMAPTEILAEQHYRTLASLLSGGQDLLWQGVFSPPYLDRPIRVALLTGGLKPSDKAAVQEAIARGETDLVVGTHALIQEGVTFANLALVVVDEQHRFGVMQRAALRAKGESPHVLVMTATPIPRTLALTVYGDLDISILDEMPPGRPPVKTYRLLPRQRQQAYDFLRQRVQQGRQAYIICPLVEESEAIAAKAAVQEFDRLSQQVFPDLRLGLVHGRLPPTERDQTMRAFRDGHLDVLVSTAVVEVGVDVPNATIMLVEGADRFGLSQLHQFRGRVRRSQHQAYCLLLAENPSEEAQERLRIVETVHDGFRLAEEDLRLRGPGEFFGVRQSGLPDLRVARLTDVDLIEEARREAARLLEIDPDLQQPEHGPLAQQVAALWGRLTAEIS